MLFRSQTYDLSILMTTHDMDMLDNYADQVALIDRTILTVGTPSDVLNSDSFTKIFHPGRRRKE